MKIGLLAAGITPDTLLPSFGSYAGMFVTLLTKQNTAFEFETFNVRNDVFPNSVLQCDAWLITGSRSNVYEREPWMLKLNEWIRKIDENKQPLVGICFGHQIIADALGGEVAKFHGGWGVGIHQYDVVQGVASLPEHLTSFSICAMHQDQVVTKPPRAKVFAHSDFCQHAGLVYGEHILTLQGHPEFSKAYETVLIESLGKSGSFSAEIAEQGRQSVAQTTLDSFEVAAWVARFIESAHRARSVAA
ncbi:type 1 glutamine amidotransferase [Marinomonas transparens]|uniref:Type 1 glutamine amidotransferase n=1 Tax=Marinomonas transparens TaxID=2795388 RepID=A0A934JU64_9GAMM|nr:type 1 glutamine amidotransferase [Marinomonas transparens]MBJ7537379.1 type 1 glutamine amidotransferase [Marinomonas transparens]